MTDHVFTVEAYEDDAEIQVVCSCGWWASLDVSPSLSRLLEVVNGHIEGAK